MDENKDLVIERIFDAPKHAVWNAWTNEELVKQWWGPEGFTAPSIKIDLRVGGKYVYAMKGPEGSAWDKVMYSAGVFKEIIRNEKLVVTDYFSDEDGNKMEPEKFGQDKNFPTEMNATILFEDIADGKTKLTIVYPTPDNKEQMEAMLKSGMKEGWQSSLNKMAKVIEI